MEATRSVSAAGAIGKLALVLLGFSVLAWLSARHLPLHPLVGYGAALGLTLTAAIGLLLVAGLLYVLNAEAARIHGGMAAVSAVASGMLMLLPFSLLALIAELALGWQAVQAFAAAGLMVGAAGIGGEMSRLGPPRLLNSLVPLAAGGLFVVAWTVLNALVRGVTG